MRVSREMMRARRRWARRPAAGSSPSGLGMSPGTAAWIVAPMAIYALLVILGNRPTRYRQAYLDERAGRRSW
jgi:hypothetical protein